MNTKWLEDESLPEGWRLRRVQRPGVGEVEIFLTTSKKIIASRHVAIDHIVKNNYELKDIMRMRNGLKRLGWEEDEKLPGFLVKKCEGHGEKSEFYSPENQRIEGVTRLLEHLLEQGCWGFTTTGYVARQVNWKQIKTARRTRLQGLMNQQMDEERDQKA